MAPSRIFSFGIFSFIMGVAVRSFFDVPSGIVWLFVCIAAGSIAVGLAKRQKEYALYGAVLLIFCAGVFRMAAVAAVPSSVTDMYGQSIDARGIVWSEARVNRLSQQLTIKVFSDARGIVREPFFILANVRLYPEYRIGDSVSISGTVLKPENFSEFDYIAYLAKQDIRAVMRYPTVDRDPDAVSVPFAIAVQKKLFSIKRAFLERIELLVPEPHASFLAGLLVGEKRAIPDDLINALRDTGTMHIVALSGFNISIIGDALLRALQLLLIPFAVSFWISSAAIILFTIMVGAEASIVRAAIMGIVALLARKHSRMYDARLALGAAAAAMIAWNPALLRFDVGFQLSFLATAGLVLLAPRLEYFLRWVRYDWMRSTLATTLAAQLAVLPLLVYYFGGVSLISPIANLLVLLVIPMTMGIGFLAGALGFLSMSIGSVIAIAAWVLLQYELSVIRFFAKMPFAHIELSYISGAVCAAVYLFVMYRIFSSTHHAFEQKQ